MLFYTDLKCIFNMLTSCSGIVVAGMQIKILGLLQNLRQAQVTVSTAVQGCCVLLLLPTCS